MSSFLSSFNRREERKQRKEVLKGYIKDLQDTSKQAFKEMKDLKLNINKYSKEEQEKKLAHIQVLKEKIDYLGCEIKNYASQKK